MFHLASLLLCTYYLMVEWLTKLIIQWRFRRPWFHFNLVCSFPHQLIHFSSHIEGGSVICNSDTYTCIKAGGRGRGGDYGKGQIMIPPCHRPLTVRSLFLKSSHWLNYPIFLPILTLMIPPTLNTPHLACSSRSFVTWYCRILALAGKACTDV